MKLLGSFYGVLVCCQLLSGVARGQTTTNTSLSCWDDPTLPGCNSCRVPSLYPGCNDPYCKSRICNDENGLNQTQCCGDSWSEGCALIATQVCIPEVLPIPPDVTCPAGFVCDTEEPFMSNCSEIRQMPIDIQFGDVFGGIYCPNGAFGMRNCPIGHYCPTPMIEDPIRCPEGEYCGYKSVEPWIDCGRCEEGAVELERYIFGYVVLGLGLFVLLLLIGLAYIHAYQKELFDRQVEMLARQTDSLRLLQRRKKKQEQLEKLRPKLEILAKRISKLVAVQVEGADGEAPDPSFSWLLSSTGSVEPIVTADTLVYETTKIYDALDTDQDGELSYEELNIALELNEYELHNFVQRMQQLGGRGGGQRNKEEAAQDTDDKSYTVSRPVFVKHFLSVLGETDQLTVSPGEAAGLYDEIRNENERTYVDEKMLYTCSISKFLSDKQIYVLIKKFRSMREESIRGSELFRHESLFNVKNREDSSSKTSISRAIFVRHYPHFLVEICTDFDESMAASMRLSDNPNVDIWFKDLSLAVKVADKSINVVDHVTGRVQAKTMTALMGGSGAGKTSLLNALCGRAYYGEVHGEIHINGQPKDIEEIKDTVGFVPQDDIVYAELTVRENFIYAGKFRLPKGTSRAEIEELADETLASLGLSRVADSMVGDVRRRGVSGGEKKRVNIGLELMAKPSCLFLDEPTSGLDASSALLVMSSMKHLVDVRGVTVVSVIHQPRKFIFDLFDSLILLGVGGKMVYHGPTDRALGYFEALDYVLPAGESVADFMIDISSGRLEPQQDVAATKALEKEKKSKKSKRKKSKRKKKKKKENEEKPVDVEASESQEAVEVEHRSEVLVVNDDEVVGAAGVSTGKANDAFEEAKSRRAWLYEVWNEHFDNLNEEERKIYDAPPESPLPLSPTKQAFISQLYSQVTRAFLVSWRNKTSKLIDTVILILAAVLLTVSSGLPEMTFNRNPKIEFADLVQPTDEIGVARILRELYKYALSAQFQYPLKIGIICAVLIGLQATRILTSKRIEFFREASSGYNINAYFVAVNIVATIEHSLQIIITAFFAAWLREPIAHWSSFFIHLIMLIWICVSWALFVPMVFPPDNVVIVIGFFLTFCGLMISGAFPPVTWAEIYAGGYYEHISAWLSPTRFFFEALTVGEYRCLPAQSGFTIDAESVNYDRMNSGIIKAGLAGHDLNATLPSCDGWYWGVLPSFFVGFTVRYVAWLAMHGLNRAQQTKKPLMFEMKRNRRVLYNVIGMIVVFIALVLFTTWLYTRDIAPNFETNYVDVQQLRNEYTREDAQAVIDANGF